MLQNDPTEALKNKDQVAVQSILDSRRKLSFLNHFLGENHDFHDWVCFL